MTSIFASVDTMARGLDFHMDRQNLISGNIANVDTPGYAPKDAIRPERTFGQSFLVSLQATNQKHIGVQDTSSLKDYEVIDEYNTAPGNEKNYVSLEHEMSRLAANTLKFEGVAKLISKQLGIIKYAARDGR